MPRTISCGRKARLRAAFFLRLLPLFAPLAALLLFAAAAARAAEFEARGQWIMSFGYGENGKFVKTDEFTGFSPGQDNFNPRQKVSLQIDACASENLGGSLYLDIGDVLWGQDESGGALGADAPIVKVADAFIDWSAQAAPLKLRMGIQSLKTPAFASGNSIFNGSAAGVVASFAFTDAISLTGAWARAYNDNHSDGSRPVPFADNVDAFGLLLPFQTEKARLIPWAACALIEPDAARAGNARYPFGNFSAMGGDAGNFREGMFPAGGARHKDFSDANGARAVASRANVFWTGITGEFDVLPHLRASFDFEYGHSDWTSDSRLNRRGWLAALNVESGNTWGVPGVYAWYGSGDDGDPSNGSERLPALDPGNSINFSPLAYDGAPYIERDALIGNNLAGSMGIGVKAARMQLLNNVSQTFHANYIRGTNSREMARKMSLAGLWANGMELAAASLGAGYDLGLPNLYMTEGDFAVELAATAHYRRNDHFSVFCNAGWIGLWLDASENAWGARHAKGLSIPSTADAWNLNMTFVYYF